MTKEDITRATSKGYLTVANMVLIIGLLIQQVRWQQTVDHKITSLEKHTEDSVLHPDFREQIRLFVPRNEMDQRLKNIENTLEKIDKKLK